MNLRSLASTSAESSAHKVLKIHLSEFLYENNVDITEKSLEKYLGKRFADIYYKFKGGKEVVVEIQNSTISVQEIKNRTKDYNKEGIYVLWLLHGRGTCVASPKSARDKKEVRISPTEGFLHKMYGGRVYYINLIASKRNVSVSLPFALHFSKLLNKKKRGRFKSRFSTFYFRRSNFVKLSNWKLLFTEFLGYKIARFYDKNIKSQLKEEILQKIHSSKNNEIMSKRHLRDIKKSFKKKYGKYMVLRALMELNKRHKISISHKSLKRIQKKLW